MKYSITIHQNLYEVEVAEISGGVAQVFVNGESFRVHLEKHCIESASASTEPAPKPKVSSAPAGGSETVKAPIPGMIIDVPVSEGDAVKPGQVLVVMEAMKMENNIIATVSGTVKEVRVAKGSQVATGDVLVVIG
jgi:biotin carboxyl carrier protein